MVERFRVAWSYRMRTARMSFLQRLVLTPRMAAITFASMSLRQAGMTLPCRARTFWGRSMFVVLPEVVSSEILRYGYIEEAVVAAMLAHVKPGDVVLDIGAHLGFFSLLAAHLVGPSGRVHALEPVPSTFAMLARNLEGLPNATAHNLAAWSEPTEITINDFGLAHSAFNSVRRPRLTDAAASTRSRPIKTRAVSLDAFAREHRLRPTFVKIDAESAEGEVLAGMRWLLEEVRPVLCVEVGDLGVEEAAPSTELVRTLTSSGYRALEFADAGFRSHQRKLCYGYGNLLFCPSDDARQAS